MIYRFENIELDTRRQILRRGGEIVEIEPQIYALLELLITRHDRLISKTEINDVVWGGRIVSETAIATRIGQARKAIGDDGRTQRLIKTHHGRGLRFLLTPTQHESAQAPLIAPPDDDILPSVVVLPFRARPDSEMELFTADALVDEISALLTVSESLRVIPRYAAGLTLAIDADPFAVAAQAGAQYAVGGQIGLRDDALRVRVNLLSVADKRILWTERFEGTLSDLFRIEDEVTSHVIGALGGAIPHREALRIARVPPSNLKAWELARRALLAAMDWRPETLKDAVENCRRATVLDPDYAQAHGYLAYFLGWRMAQGWSDNPGAERREAEKHVEHAQRLTRRDGEVLSAIGDTYRVLGDAVKAAQFYDTAKARHPQSFHLWPVSLPIMGITYAQAGRDAEARACVQEFEDKFSGDQMGRIWSRVALGYIELCVLNYAEVERLHANPPSEYNAMCRVIALVQLSREAEAKAEIERLSALNPNFSFEHYRRHFRTFHIDPEIGVALSGALDRLALSL